MNAPTQTNTAHNPANNGAPSAANEAAPQRANTTMTVSKGNQFARSFTSELRKMLSLRSTIVWAILFTGCLYGFMVLYGLFSPDGVLEAGWGELTTGSMIFMLLSAVFGASTTASEFNNKMNAHAFLTQKGRWQWLTARLLVVVLFLEIMWFVGIGLAWIIVSVWPNSVWTGGSFTAVWASAIGMPVYALIGAGVAALTRSRVAGLTLPLVWMLVIENILYGFREKYEFAKFLYHWSPGHVVQDITMREVGMEIPGSVSLEHGLVVFAIWTVVAVVAGLMANQKRDVN